MKTLSTLKTLPLVGLMALGVAMAPVVSQADTGKIGHAIEKQSRKHDGGKGQYRDGGKSHRSGKGHYDRGHGYKSGHNKGHKKHAYTKGHKRGHNYYSGHSQKNYGHKHNSHKHHGHGHKHADYVVVHDHYSDYDPFRLMLGLHLDNIELIYRDF